MEINKNAFYVQFYKWFYLIGSNYDLPKSLCPFFWKLLFATIITVCIYSWYLLPLFILEIVVTIWDNLVYLRRPFKHVFKNINFTPSSHFSLFGSAFLTWASVFLGSFFINGYYQLFTVGLKSEMARTVLIFSFLTLVVIGGAFLLKYFENLAIEKRRKRYFKHFEEKPKKTSLFNVIRTSIKAFMDKHCPIIIWK